MSESAPEDYNPNLDEEDGTPPGPEDDGEQSQEDTPDDAAKLKKALERERRAKKKVLSDLSELRKQAQQGDPNKGEMEKLTEQVEKLQKSIATKDRVTALLEAGFNQPSDKAERMLRMVDNFDDGEWIEELKVDYPERFGKQRQPSGGRPSTGHGRDESRGPAKDADTRHSEALLRMGRR
jgi:hypothetical protein